MRISDWSSDVCSSDLSTECGEGSHANGTGTGNTAVGAGSLANGDGNTAIGAHSIALSEESYASGYAATAYANGSYASGYGASAVLLSVKIPGDPLRSEENTYELQSPMRTSYAFFCTKK